MGLVVGRWQFENRDGVPSTEALATALAAATKLQVTHQLEDTQHERIDIPLLGESLFDIERAEGEMTLYSYVPAHPYLWENLDRVLVELGGAATVGRDVLAPGCSVSTCAKVVGRAERTAEVAAASAHDRGVSPFGSLRVAGVGGSRSGRWAVTSRCSVTSREPRAPTPGAVSSSSSTTSKDLRTNELELGSQRDLVALQSSDLPTGGNELTPRLLCDVGCAIDRAEETIGFQGRQDAAGGSCLGNDLVDLVHVERTMPSRSSPWAEDALLLQRPHGRYAFPEALRHL
jgi:hypothetical protein